MKNTGKHTMNQGFQKFLKDWFDTLPGLVICQQEKRLLDDALKNLFGYFLIQLGSVSNESLLTNSRITSKVLVDETLPQNTEKTGLHWVQAELDFLPIGKEKADVVVLPHTLETVDDPYYLLRQVDSMLLPEGHMVITGFNGLACMPFRLKYLARLNGFNQAQYRRVSRLKEWLAVLGYEVKLVNYSPVMCFAANEKYKSWARFIEKLEQALQRLGLNFGNVYCVVAKKHVDSPTLVGMKWHLPKWQGIRNGAIATQRSGNYKNQSSSSTTELNKKAVTLIKTPSDENS